MRRQIVGVGKKVAAASFTPGRSQYPHSRDERRIIRAQAAARACGVLDARTRAPRQEPARRRQGHGFTDRTPERERGPVRRPSSASAFRAWPSRKTSCCEQNWQGAWLERPRARSSGTVCRRQRVRRSTGRAIFLNAGAVQNVGFALHELATNASKHGALSSPQGRVLGGMERAGAMDAFAGMDGARGPCRPRADRQRIRASCDYRACGTSATRHLQPGVPPKASIGLWTSRRHTRSVRQTQLKAASSLLAEVCPTPVSSGWPRCRPITAMSQRSRRCPELESRSLRVLIVEDEFFISLHTKSLLQSLGHAVVGIAVSADQAIRIAERERPDVVLMDIRLIGARDGIEAAEEILAQFGIRSMFITANTDPQTRDRAAAVKPLGFLEKPLTEQRLQTGLRRLTPD